MRIDATRLLWLAVRFPLLGFEVHRLKDDDRPTALVEANRVTQVDALARRAGIRVGVTLATAHSISPQLRHLQRDVEAERKRLEWLALVGYRYSSRVSIAPPAQVLVEVRGSLRLFGGLAALARELAIRYRLLGHETRMAAGATPLAALALARRQESAGPGLGGAEQEGPGGAERERSGEMGRAGAEGPGRAERAERTEKVLPCPFASNQALRAVPIACADFEQRDVERLANMGIRRLGQLLDLPLRELGQRFPPALLDRLHRLTGRKADPRPPARLPERYRFRVHLLEGANDKNALLAPMRRVIDQLTRCLVARNLGTRLLVWTFKPLSGADAVVRVRLAEACADAAALLRLSQLRLERVDLPREVMSVFLHADLVTPLPPADMDFLGVHNGGGAPFPVGKRTELVDQLTARLGDDAVRALAVVDDHRPEAAWTATPAVAGARATTPSMAKQGARPLWLLDPPAPVAVRHFAIESGPERIETGWWDASQARDYFVATTASGGRCWLYRDQQRRWFLHGYFA